MPVCSRATTNIPESTRNDLVYNKTVCCCQLSFWKNLWLCFNHAITRYLWLSHSLTWLLRYVKLVLTNVYWYSLFCSQQSQFIEPFTPTELQLQQLLAVSSPDVILYMWHLVNLFNQAALSTFFKPKEAFVSANASARVPSRVSVVVPVSIMLCLLVWFAISEFSQDAFISQVAAFTERVVLFFLDQEKEHAL